MKILSTSSLLPVVATLLIASSAAQTPCAGWNVVDVPFDPNWTRAFFRDVSALPDGSAWAVGAAEIPSPPNGPETVTLAMRYANGQWEQTPTPYVATVPGGANDYLHAVAALAPDDVWAAGERDGDAGGVSVGAWLHVIHWDGNSWSEMPVPPPTGGAGINYAGLRVYDIAAFASDDVWFAGQWAEPNNLGSVTWRPLAMHWDGSGMTVAPTPAVHTGSNPMHMRQMAAVNANDIWGICRTNTAGGVTGEPTILHYDGSSWTQVTTPSLGTSVVLNDIVASSANDVWVFGHTYFPNTPFALHWDGNSFSVLNDAPYATTATAQAAGEIYLGTSRIELFDGNSSTTVESFPGVNSPSVLGMDSRATCQSWAVGRTWDAPGGNLAPFAAVMGTNGLGSLYCFGDGAGTLCPCGNQGTTGGGCTNSVGSGARLLAQGTTSVSTGNLALSASHLVPGQAGLYFQGTADINGGGGALFGDGLRCVGGNVTRLEVRMANADGQSVTTLPIAATVGVSPGDVRYYQLWYRDSVASPCTTGFNLSNGLEITWTP